MWNSYWRNIICCSVGRNETRVNEKKIFCETNQYNSTCSNKNFFFGFAWVKYKIEKRNINIRFGLLTWIRMIIKRCFWNREPGRSTKHSDCFPSSNVIPLFSSAMFRSGKKEKSEDCSFPSRVWGKMIEKWRKTSLRILVFLFGSDRFEERFSFSNSFLSTTTILREYVRGRERHNWGIIGLWCLFFCYCVTFVLEMFKFSFQLPEE